LPKYNVFADLNFSTAYL